MTHNRRENIRVPDSRLVTEFSGRVPFVSSIVNISDRGMYTVKPAKGISNSRGKIQVEIPVPEANGTVWATGDVLYERHFPESVGTGIRFDSMAQSHRKLLNELIEHNRHRIMEDMLKQIMWQKELGRYNNVFEAGSPPVLEHTVPMFRIDRENGMVQYAH